MEKHHVAIIPVMFVNYDLPDMADDCLLVCMPLCNSLGKSEPPPKQELLFGERCVRSWLHMGGLEYAENLQK